MKKFEMKVTALEKGTVIDHIPAGSVLKVHRILNLENCENSLRIGVNLSSQTVGKKDLLKIEDHYLTQEEANKLALVAPNATINIIKDWKVANKMKISIPDEVTGIKCANPRCITRHDNIPTRFKVMDKKTLNRVLDGLSDKNIRFRDLPKLLNNFWFSSKTKGELTSMHRWISITLLLQLSISGLLFK